MCDTCGCHDHENIIIRKPGEDDHFKHDHHNHHHEKVISVEKDALYQNNLIAERNRGFLEARKVKAFNLMSSPGSGKTSLLEKTIQVIGNRQKIFVIEGDQQTLNDANRIKKAGAPAIQVNTGNGCHLDAHMVNHAITELDIEENSLLFIENVGNLICPALFDLGELKRIVIISVTEGEDKPLKYPDMFRSSHLCIINKTDLLPYITCDVIKLKEYASRVNHHIEFIETSAINGDGIKNWISWLKGQ